MIERIKQIKQDYPELTFDNDGYEYLSPEVREKHKEVIAELEEMLKTMIDGFVRFDNFKPRKDGTWVIRCQHYWDSNFTGVGYFKIVDIKNYLNNKGKENE